MEPVSRHALEQTSGNVISLIGLPVWLVLSIAGLLPGTGKVAINVEKLQRVTQSSTASLDGTRSTRLHSRLTARKKPRWEDT
jgi:hypothetical protein